MLAQRLHTTREAGPVGEQSPARVAAARPAVADHDRAPAPGRQPGADERGDRWSEAPEPNEKAAQAAVHRAPWGRWIGL